MEEPSIMARTSNRLPQRFPIGAKYVVESNGSALNRFVEFPNGRTVMLKERVALSCTTQSGSQHSAAIKKPARQPRAKRERLRANSR
jgi:hypothetical protein